MISIDEALKLIADQTFELHATDLAVDEALNHFLAEPISATLNLPPFDNSAMDGYAVGDDSGEYTLKGEIAAGATGNVLLGPGEACRIFTGAPVPTGSYAVVMQEKCIVANNRVSTEKPRKGQNIRVRGEEILKGDLIFSAGTRLTAAALGMLSSFGITKVSVFEKPSVSILVTGNELVNPGAELEPGQIYESNGTVLRNAVLDVGFEVVEVSRVSDDLEATKAQVAALMEKSEVLLISGGISVGDYDYTGKALEENNVDEIFYKVRQKPGKPLFFGRRGEKSVFGLPGNPASALTCFHIYVNTVLKKMSGAQSFLPEAVLVPLAHDFEFNSDRSTFFKARINENAEIMGSQSSSMLRSFALSNGLVLLEQPRHYRKGDLVRCIFLNS